MLIRSRMAFGDGTVREVVGTEAQRLEADRTGDYGPLIVYDELDEDFPQANHFLTLLRDQVILVDINLHQAVTFHTNLRKGVMYIRGTTLVENYMVVLYKYLEKIPDVCKIEWKLPIFGLECIQFQFLSTAKMVEVLDDRVLAQVLAQTHQSCGEQRHKEGEGERADCLFSQGETDVGEGELADCLFSQGEADVGEGEGGEGGKGDGCPA